MEATEAPALPVATVVTVVEKLCQCCYVCRWRQTDAGTANAAVFVGGGRRAELTDGADGAGGEPIEVSVVTVVETLSGHCQCCCLCRWRQTDGAD